MSDKSKKTLSFFTLLREVDKKMRNVVCVVLLIFI